MDRVKVHMGMYMVVLLLFHLSVSFCSALNTEGLALLRFREKMERDPFGALSNWYDRNGEIDPCEWHGVGCSGGKVVILQLKDLCLKGTLVPELGSLTHLKSIVLRNNSFFGNIPKEIGELKELEVLDLGYNNFSGSFPSDFANNLSLNTLLIDNNNFLGSISPELYELNVLSEIQADENQLRASCSSRDMHWNMAQGDTSDRMLLQAAETPTPPKFNGQNVNQSSSELSPSPSLLPPSQSPLSPSELPPMSPSPSSFSESPSPSFSSAGPSSSVPLPSSTSPILAQTPTSPAPADSPTVHFAPPQGHWVPVGPSPTPRHMTDNSSKSKHHIFVIAGIVGGSFFVLVSVIGFFFFRSSKVVTVRPWATGLSGQLQKAFVTGVPKLKRSELEAACEDFSNIIGTFSGGTVYKGTLSNGVEIAVTSYTVNWTKYLESQFRKKIDILSKVNHKNFVNLIGYCEEDEPFTRVMVFEYAPNGTLFEHLHIKESEHLDWGMRLRIAMGIAYCLEYMHLLTPPIAHRNLRSSLVYLTEDFAAKISYCPFWNDLTAGKLGQASMELLQSPIEEPENDVYSFGVILFEMITGRIPYAVGDGSILDWASDYLRGEQPLKEIVDPTLKSFQEDELEKLHGVIESCTNPDPKQRPRMQEIAFKLKEITAMGPEGAAPKLSPLWWAELEIISTDGS